MYSTIFWSFAKVSLCAKLVETSLMRFLPKYLIENFQLQQFSRNNFLSRTKTELKFRSIHIERWILVLPLFKSLFIEKVLKLKVLGKSRAAEKHEWNFRHLCKKIISKVQKMAQKTWKMRFWRLLNYSKLCKSEKKFICQKKFLEKHENQILLCEASSRSESKELRDWQTENSTSGRNHSGNDTQLTLGFQRLCFGTNPESIRICGLKRK